MGEAARRSAPHACALLATGPEPSPLSPAFKALLTLALRTPCMQGVVLAGSGIAGGLNAAGR